MDLKDFIQSAVSQIVEGMVAAEAAAAAHGASLGPAFVPPGGKGIAPGVGQAAATGRVSNIGFDIAVIALEGDDAEGGATLQVAGAGGDLHANVEHVTRLQFSLPIVLPEARVKRSAAKALDSEFLQSVENDDSTWLPAR